MLLWRQFLYFTVTLLLITKKIVSSYLNKVCNHLYILQKTKKRKKSSFFPPRALSYTIHHSFNFISRRHLRTRAIKRRERSVVTLPKWISRWLGYRSPLIHIHIVYPRARMRQCARAVNQLASRAWLCPHCGPPAFSSRDERSVRNCVMCSCWWCALCLLRRDCFAMIVHGFL